MKENEEEEEAAGVSSRGERGKREMEATTNSFVMIGHKKGRKGRRVDRLIEGDGRKKEVHEKRNNNGRSTNRLYDRK